jgi:glucose/arabinose dehydrogenase
MRRRFLLSVITAGVAAPSVVRAQGTLKSAKAAYRLVTLTRELEQPWGMAFLPDGRMLITERPGRLRVFADGKLEAAPLTGVPKVYVGGQAGLLDICLHPAFATNRVLYLSYIAGNDRQSVTSVARAELGDSGLSHVQTVFEALPGASRQLNLGSRIVFDREGFMYVSVGDGYQMNRAQDLGDLAGKIVRLKDDGSIPADNPFVNRPLVKGKTARPEIFTYGNRNPQGLAMHPVTGRIWEVEHGPKGGDELNILKAGANYGWPLATHGINYDGSKITDHASLPGMEDPLRWWVPSISPCGLTFYTGDRFPGWRGSIFTGALTNKALFRIEVDGEKYVGEERLLVGRLPFIRDVRQGPNGFLYLVTHADDGGLYRLEPA